MHFQANFEIFPEFIVMTWNHLYLSLVRARGLFSKVTVSGGELLRRHIAFTPVDHSDFIP